MTWFEAELEQIARRRPPFDGFAADFLTGRWRPGASRLFGLIVRVGDGRAADLGARTPTTLAQLRHPRRTDSSRTGHESRRPARTYCDRHRRSGTRHR